MNPTPYNIYLIGVGGQGIGLLSEVMARAADLAGHAITGVDTHGLAQRGGTVESHLRLGPTVRSPLIQPQQAHLVAALERHEALRGAASYLRPGGTLVYYDAVWQPLSVRLRREPAATAADVEALCRQHDLHLERVFRPDLADARMQNVAVLGTLARARLVPDITAEHYESALRQLLNGSALEANLALFRHVAGTA